jgi:hypothetical protein
VRSTHPLRFLGAALALASALAGAAGASQAIRPAEPATVVKTMRGAIDHYRALTWTYERAAREPRVPTRFSYRRSSDPAYLQWTLDTWTRRAYRAQRDALVKLHRKLAVTLPAPPRLHARLLARVAYNRRLALRLRRIYPGGVTRSFATARGKDGRSTLRLWQARSARAALAVALHGVRQAGIPGPLRDAFLCIHSYEGAWSANTGNGYYGGLQMDLAFQRLYGRDFLGRWGTADRWPPWAQLTAAARAHDAGRGFGPWPNTAAACGLL